MSNSVSYLALSCIGAFATAPAFAAPDPTEPDDQHRPDVVVQGQRQDQPSDPKQVAPLVDTPRSIVVLPAQVIEQTGSNSLQDALRTVPGITFGAAEGGNPIGDRPFIRGFDSQGSIYVDGVRDLAAQTREVFAVDQVEIVRGSDSTLGGRGSAGGTLNIVSRLPRTGDFGSVLASYGAADYKRVSGDLNLQVAPAVAVRIQGVWHDQDVAGRDAVYQRRWGVAPSVTIGLGGPTRLTATYYYLESHELPDSGIPYLYTIGNAPGSGNVLSQPAIGRVTLANGTSGYVPRTAFYGLADRDFRDAKTHQAMVRVEHDFGALTLRNTARYSYSDQAYIYTQPDDTQGNVYGTTATNAGANLTSGGYVWRRANTRYGYTQSMIDQTDLSGRFHTGSVEHSIALGTEFAWEKARRGTFVTRGYLNASGVEILSTGSTITPRCTTATVTRNYCTGLFAPNPNDPWANYTSDTSTTPAAIVRSLPQEETQNDGTTQAAYAFDSISLTPRLILNLGARYDRFTSVIRPGGTYATTTQVQLRRVDSLFNWQAGLVFKPTRETSVYASYATSATPPNSLLGEGREDNALPTTATAANLQLLDSLKPQKTRSYEVGAKASLFHERLQLGAAAFQTDIDNARVTSDSNTAAFIGRSRIRGVELTASGTVLPGWTVFGGYTWLDPVIVDGGYTALTAAAVGAQPAQVVLVPSVNTDKQLPQTARNQFTGTTSVELVHGVQIGGSVLYTSRQYGGYADNRAASQTAAGVVTVTPATRVLYRSIPGYWRFDARASWQVTPHLQLSVNAQNLTDKVYFSQAYASHYATIAPGRTVFGTVGGDVLSIWSKLSPAEAREALSGPARVALIREAAEAGLAEAQAVLGQMLLDGAELPADPRAGFGWFMRAAAQEHVLALNMVGRCYELGWGVAPDPARAADCYRVAAARGLPEAMYNWATQLALGRGVTEDKGAALGWLRRAAATGYAKAENFVGSFHEDGWATPVDLLAAAQCYARAAHGGDFRGCFNHARMLVRKHRVREALPWIERALALGTPRFRAQVRDWLEAQDDAELRLRGIAAADRC